MKTVNLSLIWLTGLLLVGCGTPTSTVGPNKPEDTEASFQYVSVVKAEIAPSLSEGQRPTSAEQLMKEFRSVAETDPEKAFIEFIDWTGVPETERKEKLGQILHALNWGRDDGIYEFAGSKLYSLSEYCNLLDSTPEELNEGREVAISHIMEVKFNNEVPINLGERNGRFYILFD